MSCRKEGEALERPVCQASHVGHHEDKAYPVGGPLSQPDGSNSPKIIVIDGQSGGHEQVSGVSFPLLDHLHSSGELDRTE